MTRTAISEDQLTSEAYAISSNRLYGGRKLRLLLFNLITDAVHLRMGFTTVWISSLAAFCETIDVVTMMKGEINVPSNVRVYSVGKEKGYSEPRRLIEFYRCLFRILRHRRIDACFSHMIPIFTILAAPILKVLGIPLITWYAHPKLSNTLKVAHHFSDLMVTSFPTTYPYLHNKLAVIGQGINTDLFSPGESIETSDTAMILCVGRISPAKEHKILLNAIALLCKWYGEVFHAVILGEPATPSDAKYLISLQRYAATLEIENITHFQPAVPYAELPYWYQKCTVHINLTPEGFGDKCALEAMSCGRPCIIANEAFRETVGKFADQLIFRERDAHDLARKLLWLLKMSSEDRNEIGSYLRQQVIKMHGLKRLSKLLIRRMEFITEAYKE